MQLIHIINSVNNYMYMTVETRRKEIQPKSENSLGETNRTENEANEYYIRDQIYKQS